MASIPKYARSIPVQFRVSFLCKTGCHMTRFGRRDLAAGSITCGKCGRVQYDKSNWTRG